MRLGAVCVLHHIQIKEIESHNGQTVVSEGIDANYMDMINYAVFGLIKIVLEKDNQE